jgi:hypothetical protein
MLHIREFRLGRGVLGFDVATRQLVYCLVRNAQGVYVDHKPTDNLLVVCRQLLFDEGK